MPAASVVWTVEMLDALPDDGQRYELVDGELFVTPAPTDVHQLVVGEFLARLHDYLRGSSIGRVLVSPADVRRGEWDKNRVQPDVFAVRLIDGKRPSYPYAMEHLLLAIEVISPGSARLDYLKRDLYLRNGIPEYWIVNVDALAVSRWRTLDDPGKSFTDRIEWTPVGMAAPLVLDLPALFEDALG